MRIFGRLKRAIQGPFAEAEFCFWCGDRLVITEEVAHFDPQTGRGVVERRGDCPRIVVGGPFDGRHPARRSPMRGGQL